MSKVRISSKGYTSHTAKVELDGHDVSNSTRGLRLDMRVGEVPQLELDVIAIEVEAVDVEYVRAYVPEETRDLLVRLGWTPPPDPPRRVEVWQDGAWVDVSDDQLALPAA